MIKRLKVKRYI